VRFHKASQIESPKLPILPSPWHVYTSAP